MEYWEETKEGRMVNSEQYAFDLEQSVKGIEEKLAELKHISEAIRQRAAAHAFEESGMRSLKIESHIAREMEKDVRDLIDRLTKIEKNG